MSSSIQIIGILNCTPDSYFDGGEFLDVHKAIERAGELLSEGADWIDIGGESTFVDRDDVSIDEELSRVMPVIQGILNRYPEAKLSIDTYKSEVAKEAVEAGVRMVNDVTGGRGDTSMFDVVARSTEITDPGPGPGPNWQGGIPLFVMMYAKHETSRTTMDEVHYDDVIVTVKEFLTERKQIALDAGIPAEAIILDPGLGFFISSVAKYSFEIIARFRELEELSSPLYLSPSRKSFLAGPQKLEPADRLPGTIAASVLAAQNGATYIRTHDVAEVRRGIEVVLAMRGIAS